MNLKIFMKEHERKVRNYLYAKGPGCYMPEMKETHERMIGYIQHERLIHLIVTIGFGVFLLITMAIALVKPSLLVLLLMGLFLVLLVPYVIHYFFLENTVQRWYKVTDDILSAGDKKPSVSG